MVFIDFATFMWYTEKNNLTTEKNIQKISVIFFHRLVEGVFDLVILWFAFENKLKNFNEIGFSCDWERVYVSVYIGQDPRLDAEDYRKTHSNCSSKNV